jgi:hypothetical protein
MIKRWFGWCLLTGLGIACQTVVGATGRCPNNTPKVSTKHINSKLKQKKEERVNSKTKTHQE